MRLTLLSIILMVGVATGCGEADAVPAPFFTDAQLVDQTCSDPGPSHTCHVLRLSVHDHDGSSNASCVIYPLGTEGIELSVDATQVADLDPDTVYHEVFITDPFTIRSGDAPSFDVVLPVLDDPDFVRWQVVCNPGPPG